VDEALAQRVPAMSRLIWLVLSCCRAASIDRSRTSGWDSPTDNGGQQWLSY